MGMELRHMLRNMSHLHATWQHVGHVHGLSQLKHLSVGRAALHAPYDGLPCGA